MRTLTKTPRVGAPISRTSSRYALKKATRQRNPVAPDLADVIPYKLYDTYTLAAATAVPTEIQFFTVPQSATKTKLLTNLEQAGRLPDPRHFFVRALRFIFQPNSLLADIKGLMLNYYVEFWIGGKIYMEGPIFLFPGGAGINGTTTQSTAETWANGIPDVTAVDDYGDKGFSILQGQTFKIKMINGGAAYTSAAVIGINLLCVLDGLISREVQ